MQEVVWLQSAVDDLVRLRQFIAQHNPTAARKAALEIQRSIKGLVKFPLIGKPVEELIEYRDLQINFGVGGYIVRYRIYNKVTYIVHIKHSREGTFKR